MIRVNWEKLELLSVYRREFSKNVWKGASYNDIEKKLARFINKILKFIKNFEQGVSGWTFIYIKSVDLNIFDYIINEGAMYIDLPNGRESTYENCVDAARSSQNDNFKLS